MKRIFVILAVALVSVGTVEQALASQPVSDEVAQERVERFKRLYGSNVTGAIYLPNGRVIPASTKPLNTFGMRRLVLDPGGGGNSYCWQGLHGTWAYFVDWQARMVGWFRCLREGYGNFPFIVWNKPGYGDVYPWCSLGNARYTWDAWVWWRGSEAAYC